MSATEAKPFTCPGCKQGFRTLVGLRFHIKKEHPGTYDAAKSKLNRLEREQNVKLRAELESNGKIPKQLLSIYKDCPCGASYEEHLRRAALHGRFP